ncbi:MAG TPA: KGK domain-containing protein [Halomicronema sp.]
MDKEFRPVELNDDDVISFDKSTFKNGDLKEFIRSHFWSWYNSNARSMTFNLGGINKSIPICTQFYLFPQGINSEILRLGSAKWEKGLLRIYVDLVDLSDPQRFQSSYINVNLEFCSEEIPAPPEHESPLDDIRRLI